MSLISVSILAIFTTLEESLVIEKLREIRKLRFKIKRIDEQIEDIRGKMEHHAIIYSDLPKNPGYKDNIMEMFMSRIEELELEKSKIQLKIDMILDEISFLPEASYRVLIYKYVDEMSWEQISQKLGYSKSSCQRFCNNAKKISF